MMTMILLQNFTVLNSMKLLSVIQELFESYDTDLVYVHPITSGSMIYSWHNSSLVNAGGVCPFADIQQLEELVLYNGKLRTFARKRFDAIVAYDKKNINSC